MSYYSLVALALSSPLGSFDLTFWGIVHLLVVTGGMAWLLLRRVLILEHLSESQSRLGLMLLVSLVYLFILAKIVNPDNGEIGLFLLDSILVSIAFIGAWFSGPSPFLFSRLDRAVLIGGGIAISANLLTQTILGPGNSQVGYFKWVGTIRIIELTALCLAVSRLLRGEQARGLGLRLLVVTTIAFAVISSVGIWRIGVAYYHYDQLMQSFRSGQYKEVREYASRITMTDPNLRFQLVSLESALNSMVRAAASSKGNLDTYAVIGDLADRYHLWGIAADVYRDISNQNPNYPAIHAKVGNCLFEQGMRAEAMDTYRKGVGQPKIDTEDYLAMGVALARMEEWEDADRVLCQAIELGGLTERFRALTSSGQELASERINALVPYGLQPYLEKLTLYRVVRLLEFRGWRVLHPAMQIGSTGITTPNDIVAISGGGSTFLQEHLWVNGKEVSTHKRGYNVAVIDPQTGIVDTTESFDTWLSPGEGNRLAGFLKGIARGKIVAATVSDEGSDALSGAAKSALQEEVGVSQLPRSWWSHAFIGIKGSASGTASETIASPTTLVTVGVLKANVPDEAMDNRSELETLLRRAAEEAPGKVAIYIPSLDAAATITVACR